MKNNPVNKIYSTTPNRELKRLWREISWMPCPSTIYLYINCLSEISKLLRNVSSQVLRRSSKPWMDPEEILEELDETFSSLVEFTNNVHYELSCRYKLPRKHRRLMQRIVNKNEDVGIRVSHLLQKVMDANDALFDEDEVDKSSKDSLAKEIPYHKNFSVILKDFLRYRFQEN